MESRGNVQLSTRHARSSSSVPAGLVIRAAGRSSCLLADRMVTGGLRLDQSLNMSASIAFRGAGACLPRKGTLPRSLSKASRPMPIGMHQLLFASELLSVSEMATRRRRHRHRPQAATSAVSADLSTAASASDSSKVWTLQVRSKSAEECCTRQTHVPLLARAFKGTLPEDSVGYLPACCLPALKTWTRGILTCGPPHICIASAAEHGGAVRQLHVLHPDL